MPLWVKREHLQDGRTITEKRAKACEVVNGCAAKRVGSGLTICCCACPLPTSCVTLNKSLASYTSVSSSVKWG